MSPRLIAAPNTSSLSNETQIPASDTDERGVGSQVEQELGSFFVNLAQALGLPKSHGEIYAVLFCSAQPISFDEVIEKTGISKGGASQSLRLLQNINAVRQVHVAKDRRSFYEPELRMRHLLAGFLRQTVEPHLERGAAHIDRILELSEDELVVNEPVLQERIQSLQNWNKKATNLIPWIRQMASPSLENQPSLFDD